MSIHVIIDFGRQTDPQLDEFASNVAVKMAANAAIFVTPIIPLAALTAAQVAFHNSLLALTQGGTAATADKNAKRLFLENLLHQQGTYVQNIPVITEANMQLSGYATTTLGHHAAVTLGAPVILGFTNPGTTQLGLKLQGVPGATGYEFYGRVGGGPLVYLGRSSATHNIILPNLLPGTVYAVQARAVAGHNQTGPFSDPVSHMCQ